METKSILSMKEIVNLSFINTSSVIEKNSKPSSYFTWGYKAVQSLVMSISEKFYSEKENFINLSKDMGDLPLSRLSFKKTEGLIEAWKSSIYKGDWWDSEVKKHLRQLAFTLMEEKRELINRSNSKLAQ